MRDLAKNCAAMTPNAQVERRAEERSDEGTGSGRSPLPAVRSNAGLGGTSTIKPLMTPKFVPSRLGQQPDYPPAPARSQLPTRHALNRSFRQPLPERDRVTYPSDQARTNRSAFVAMRVVAHPKHRATNCQQRITCACGQQRDLLSKPQCGTLQRTAAL